MRQLFYSLCLLPILGYAGGDIQPIEMNYDNYEDVVVAEEPPVVVPEKKQSVVEVIPKKEVVVPPVVVPSSNYYVGLSGAIADVDGSSSSIIIENANPLAVIGKMGYNFSDNLGIEGRAGVGIKKDEINALANSEVDQVLGVYLKPNVDIAENINLFALLGYANAQQKLNDTKLKTDGFSGGIGLGYKVTEAWEVVADAVRYGKEDSNRLDMFSLGLNYNF